MPSPRIICFSLWGDDPTFAQGALENLRLAPRIYPGWGVRIYARDDVHAATLQALRTAGAEVIVKRQTRGAWEGLFWRFLPASDPSVERFICRDLDCRLNERERAAVDEWIASGRAFHTMRDHVEHGVPIPGGMWGATRDGVPEMAELIESWSRFAAKGNDQEFLERWIWPGVRDRAIAHDRYFKGLAADLPAGPYRYDPVAAFGPHDVRRFPAHPPMSHGTFVGQQFAPGGAPIGAPLVAFGGSGITRELFDWIEANVPGGANVVELGAGHISTQHLCTRYRLHSVEDNAEFLGLYGSRYIHAPLVQGWYSAESLRRDLPRSCALILVDGPAGEGNRSGFARHLDLFDTTAAIVFDDTHRPAERALAEEVGARLGRGVEHFACFSVIPAAPAAKAAAA